MDDRSALFWLNQDYFQKLIVAFAGCTGGVGRGEVLSNGLGGGGGHGGKGGVGCYNDSCSEGGIRYGNADLPCELGSGSGNESLTGSTAGGGIIGKLVVWSARTNTWLGLGNQRILRTLEN